MMTKILIVFLLFLTASSCKVQAQSPSISITPTTNDMTLFQGSEFRRICSIDGVVSGDVMTRFVWERDGAELDRVDGVDQLQLHYLEVEQVHQGEYTCHVMLIPRSGEGITISLPPVSAGTLNVLDRSLINVPSTQVLVVGTSGSLNCSYPGGLTTWRAPDDSAISGSFSQASVADEGLYTCDIYHYEPGPRANINIPVMLYVVVPVEIVDTSIPVYQNLTRNQPTMFAVDFRGRQSHDLTITWHYDEAVLASDDSRIYNSFNPSLANGRTEFRLPEANRENAGLYRVEISSQVGAEGEILFRSQQEVTFQIDVTVRPVPPINLNVDQLSATIARATWNLQADQMSDERADQLILTVKFANGSLAERVPFSGDLTSMVVENLIPATNYNLVLTAVNSDGQVTTDPFSFSTPMGEPHISSIEILRVNQTWFMLEVHLSYTGGGDITSIAVSYRPVAATTGGVTTIEGVVPDRMEGLTVRGTVVLTDQEIENMELNFTIAVRNTFGYESQAVTSRVPVYNIPVTTTMITAASTAVDSSTSTVLLPPWLIAIVASVVTMLVMLVLVACIVGVCVCCRTTTKSNKFKVNVGSVSTLSATESGMLPTKSLDSVQVDHYRARSQSSSVPSESYTPSLDEHVMDRKHKRELSESSSIGVSKLPISPSTTASNSPSNLSKGHSQCLHKIAEIEAVHSDDSGTESERDRIRQKYVLHEQKMLSPSRQNIINAHFVRSPADGCGCGSSHQSLASGCGHSDMQIVYPGGQLNYSEPKHLHTHAMSGRRSSRAEYMYSDCDSVASTVSHSNISLPCTSVTKSKHLRPVQYRSPTPYNHNYQPNTTEEYYQQQNTLTEESTV